MLGYAFAGIAIRVFIESEHTLQRQFGKIAVDTAERGWDIIIWKITMPQSVEHLAVYGRPTWTRDYLVYSTIMESFGKRIFGPRVRLEEISSKVFEGSE